MDPNTLYSIRFALSLLIFSILLTRSVFLFILCVGLAGGGGSALHKTIRFYNNWRQENDKRITGRRRREETRKIKVGRGNKGGEIKRERENFKFSTLKIGKRQIPSTRKRDEGNERSVSIEAIKNRCVDSNI